MKRRDFLNTLTTESVALLAGSTSTRRQSRLADARIEILLDEPIGKIAPELYGHFVEHLGGVVYDGIWVGENSKIHNTFENPSNAEPKEGKATVRSDGTVICVFAPASVTRLRFEI